MGRTALGAAALAVAALCAIPLPALGQYVGQVSKPDKDQPELRSIAVLEWTGDAGSPKASRLVPVAVLDGGALQDGSVYLARPEPLALAPEVEYVLQQDGKPLGLYDIKNAGQQLGSWVGFGAWKPMPAAHPKLTAAQLAKTHFDDDDAQSDQPVLHRKHHAGDSSAQKSGSGDGSASQSAPSDPATNDPDRPVLHKKPADDGTGSSGDSGSSSTASSTGPVLHKKDSSSDSSASDAGGTASTASSDDPDRPVLHKSKKAKPAADEASVESVAGDTDPDRPRLMRGKSSGPDVEVAPSLMGLPPELEQTVAVSDAQAHPVHPWDYVWANPGDEAKMKASLEDTARTALGLNPPAVPAKPARRTAAGTSARKAKPAPPPEPAPLEDEEFRVFELAYGSGATLVLSAHTAGPEAQQKFVTLIAQPDLYGNVLVLSKNVTDGAHLDFKPRMRLVDAVDAMADNRGELLFELRGATQRQFALYRVLRGQAEQLFATGAGQFSMASE
jgi:hypothetical protein